MRDRINSVSFNINNLKSKQNEKNSNCKRR